MENGISELGFVKIGDYNLGLITIKCGMYVHHLLLSLSLLPEKSNENLIRLCCKLTLSCISS